MKDAITLKSLGFSIILSICLASMQAFTCNHIQIEPGTEEISIRDAIQQLQQKHPSLKFVYNGKCSSCKSKYYAIRDDKDNELGEAEVGTDQYKGNRLLKLAGEILKVPIDQIMAVNKTRTILEEDIRALETEFGIKIYNPTKESLSHRFPGNHMQRLYVEVEKITRKKSDNTITILSRDLQVKVTEIVPGRFDYQQENIYQKGDLRGAFLANQDLIRAYKEKAFFNKSNGTCTYTDANWDEIVEHLKELKL